MASGGSNCGTGEAWKKGNTVESVWHHSTFEMKDSKSNSGCGAGGGGSQSNWSNSSSSSSKKSGDNESWQEAFLRAAGK